VSTQKVIISLLSSDLMQHTRNHLIDDINPVERSDTKYHESYPRYHVSSRASPPSTPPTTMEVINAASSKNQRSATIANEKER
jgi:hypothetical protein